MTPYLREDIAAQWAGRDPFDAAAQLQGEVFREVKTRRTLRFEAAGEHYFIKIHHGVGWPEILKNLVSGRWPIVSARQEWQAIRRLTELGVPTMSIAGFGERGLNPARRESFLITDELANTVSLETLCADWRQRRPDFAFKLSLLRRVAGISRRMHENGVCHRDFYLCHFLLHCPPGAAPDQHTDAKLSVIDLHRAMIRARLGQRWIEKDIAGLYFSSLDIGLTQTDLLRFLRMYTGQPLREALITQAGFVRRVQHKADKIWQRDQRKLEQGRLVAAAACETTSGAGPERGAHNDSRWQQWQALKPALFRDSSDQVRHRSWERFAVYRRSQASTAMDAFIRDPDSFFYQGEMLKDGDSTTVMVITLDGTPYVVKRYNLRNFWYGIRRLFRPTRAWRCWVNAHMLQTLGVATPAPVLMLERRWGPLRRQAYYMTELVAGSNVLQFVGNEPINGARWQQTLGRFRDLLQTMRRYRFVHGDMKATNIMATPDALVVLDLDAMREIRSKRVFNRYFKRDLNRWLANWRHRPDIVPVLRDTVTEIEAGND